MTEDITSSAAPMSEASGPRALHVIVTICPGAESIRRPAPSRTDGSRNEQALVQAAEHDEVRVEQVDEVADTETEPPADLRRSPGRALVPGRALGHLGQAPGALAHAGES